MRQANPVHPSSPTTVASLSQRTTRRTAFTSTLRSTPPRNSILHPSILSLTKHNFLLDKFLCRPTLFRRDTALLSPRHMSLNVLVFTPKKATTPPPGFSMTVRFIGLWMHTLITSIYNA